MTQADAFAVPGVISAFWMGPHMSDGHVPTEQERNALLWLPLQPFAGQGRRLNK